MDISDDRFRSLRGRRTRRLLRPSTPRLRR